MEQSINSSSRIDFVAVMNDLHNAGYTVYRVSQTLNVAYCTADNWATGGEPRYNRGVLLLQLHAQVCSTATFTTTHIVEFSKPQA